MKRYNRVTAFLIVLATVLSSFSASAVSSDEKLLSYDEYFSTEREWEDQSFSSLFEYRYVFIANEEALVDTSTLLPNRLYSYDLVTKDTTLLADEGVSSFDLVGEKILYTTKNQIVCIDASGNNGFTLFEDNATIGNLISNDCLAYYTKGDYWYRLHIPSKTLDCISIPSDTVFFKPISNTQVLWSDNSIDVETELVSDSICCSEADSDPEYFLTDLTTSESIKTSFPRSETDGLAPLASTFSCTINGTRIPLEDYPDGSNFTKNGQPCALHRGEKYGELTSCSNCTTLPDGSKQCAGFARMVFYEIWGAYEHPQGHGIVYASYLTPDSAGSQKIILDSIPVGTRLRVRNNGHSLMLVGKTYGSNGVISGVTIYDANWNNRCGIRVQEHTPSNFFSVYSNIYSIYGPHSPKNVTNGHYVCTISGCPMYNIKEAHYKSDGQAGYGTCVVCGYVGYCQSMLQSLGDEIE